MMRFRCIRWFIILMVFTEVVWITGCSKERRPDVRYVPTHQDVVLEMLQMAQVTHTDIVFDLGSGDGRIVITAAKVFGARGVGVDIDPARIEEGNENARKAGVTGSVKFLQQDLFHTEIGEATVVTLYLSDDLNLKLRPKLFRELKPGTRILSHEYDMADWKPDARRTVYHVEPYFQPHNPLKNYTVYYYWVIPADVAGVWRWSLSTSTGKGDYILHLVQKFQEVHGEATVNGQKTRIADARLVGGHLSFTLRNDTNTAKAVTRFKGRVSGNTIKGEVEVQGGPSAGNYSWTSEREL